jgi:translation elongation factor EF-1beta
MFIPKEEIIADEIDMAVFKECLRAHSLPEDASKRSVVVEHIAAGLRAMRLTLEGTAERLAVYGTSKRLRKKAK